MIKIFIELKDNKLNFSIKKRLKTEQKNLINTNVISQNELVFSYEYIVENQKLVASFLKELCSTTKITTITIREYDIAPLILSVIKHIPSIQAIYFLQETSLTYKICEGILNDKNIKYISVYNLQTFMLEMLDKENIIVDSRNEILFSSNFMISNKLDKFSSLYYKNNIELKFPLSPKDEEDFYSFCKINRYLKSITINTVKINDIEYILAILIKNKFKNIKIIIKENVQDIELIEYLKKLNKENEKKNHITFKIDYSKEYLENNMIEQLKLNTIKICILIVILIVLIIFVYIFISNYKSMQRVESIQADIFEIVNDNKNVINEPIIEIKPDEPEEEKEVEPLVKNKDLEALLEVNPDTVGWLTINNTNVDYPVVQSQDNDYYLDKNFYKKQDQSGWIFMDYRNDAKTLSDNTIIFGHNMYYSGVMFGTLYKTKHSFWYKNVENQTITFNTLYESMEWKIFSLYVTPVTDDYLIANFSTNEKFQSFIDMLTKRSIYDFGIPVLSTDNILTITTCANNGTNRLVIHAVRMN